MIIFLTQVDLDILSICNNITVLKLCIFLNYFYLRNSDFKYTCAVYIEQKSYCHNLNNSI